MKIAPGHPMNISAAPPGWQMTFSSDEESWTVPIIGWAVVAKQSDENGLQADIEPAIFARDSEGSGYVTHLTEYLIDRFSNCTLPQFTVEYRCP